MDLVILGLNHKTVPVAIREHFTMTPDAIHDALQHLDDYGGLREAVILSTCNRAEVYAVVDDVRDNEQALRDFFLDAAGRPAYEPSYFYSYTGKACIPAVPRTKPFCKQAAVFLPSTEAGAGAERSI